MFSSGNSISFSNQGNIVVIRKKNYNFKCNIKKYILQSKKISGCNVCDGFKFLNSYENSKTRKPFLSIIFMSQVQ